MTESKSARRFAFMDLNKGFLRKQDNLVPNCGNKLCVKPSHMEIKRVTRLGRPSRDNKLLLDMYEEIRRLSDE